MTWPSGDQPPQYEPPQYQQPQHQQPQYQPPNYGAPAYPPPAPPYGQPYPQPRTTSGWAIAALILGIVGAVLFSVVCGIIALTKTKDGKQGGRGLAIAGLVISGLWVVIGVAVVVVALVADKGSVNATDVAVGNCITQIPDSSRVFTVQTVPCDQKHAGEVYAVLNMPDGAFPGQSAIDTYQNKCPGELQSYAPSAMKDDTVGIYVLYPTQETWDRGDRAVTCIATLNPQRGGSIKGQ